MRVAPLRNLTALAIFVILFSGCALLKRKAQPAAATALPAPVPKVVGTVAVINGPLHFALLDVGSLYTPAPGTALKCFSGETQTGILAVGVERKRPFIAADIIEGTPKVGDRVEE